MRLDYSRGRTDRTVYINFYDPHKVTSMDTLVFYDKWARDSIASLKGALEAIEQYRLDLMERAQYLISNPGALSIELHRHKTYRGSVEFYLKHVRTYPDGTTNTEYSQKYSGRERHKAIADYKADCKAHPGAPCVLDIEKSPWER